MTRNAFEAVSLLACREKWCWNIGCTTCGCTHFRHAFKLLAHGKDPQIAGWPIHQGRQIPDEFGRLPMRLDPPEQQALAEILAGADLEFIARRVKFPDWLGYLGLALHMIDAHEEQTGVVTAALAPQLARMCDRTRKDSLESLPTSGERLRWQSLSEVERAIQSPWRMSEETLQRRQDDAPHSLRTLSDLAKADAIANGLERAFGRAFDCDIEAVRYSAFDRLREFNSPAELRVLIRGREGSDCAVIQEASEAVLEESVARSVGKATGKTYRARIVSRRYGRPYAAPGELRMTLLVARD